MLDIYSKFHENRTSMASGISIYSRLLISLIRIVDINSSTYIVISAVRE